MEERGKRRGEEDSPVAMAWTLGPGHAVRSANRSFLALAGSKPSTLGELLSPRSAEILEGVLGRVFETGVPEAAVEMTRQLEDGSVSGYTFVASPLFRDDGEVDGLAVSVIDCTRMLRENAALTESLREANHAVLAAELREESLAEQLAEHEAKLREEPPVADVHGVGKLHAVVEQVLADLRSTFPGRPLTHFAKGPDEGVFDVRRVASATSNLVVNALTSSPANSTVTVQSGLEGETLFVSVHNTGAPIPPAELQGLLRSGLQTVAQVAKSHGGKVSVRSTALEGTLFTLAVPARPPSAAP